MNNWVYWTEKRTITTNTSAPVQPVTDEREVRRIVREELADIIPIDVPDFPPEDGGRSS